MKIVCFTAIMVDDEQPNPIDIPGSFEKINGIDYILLTNIPNGEAVFSNTSWTVKVVDDPPNLPKTFRRIYANRWFKWHPSHMFGDMYDVAIYVDGITIIDSSYAHLWKVLAEACVNPNYSVAVCQDYHNVSRCIYEELGNIVYHQKDTFEHMRAVELYLRSEGFPANYGLLWNGCYVYALHKQPKIEQIWHQLWEDMILFTYRDQSLYMFHMWKHDAKSYLMPAPLYKMVQICGQFNHDTAHRYITV